MATRMPDASVPIGVGILLPILAVSDLAIGVCRRVGTLFPPPLPHVLRVSALRSLEAVQSG